MLLKTKSGRLVELPTAEEAAKISKGISSDPDTYELTGKEFKQLKRIGRPPSPRPLKVPTTIRFDADVLTALKAFGPGWQTRVNAILREYVNSAH